MNEKNVNELERFNGNENLSLKRKNNKYLILIFIVVVGILGIFLIYKFFFSRFFVNDGLDNDQNIESEQFSDSNQDFDIVNGVDVCSIEAYKNIYKSCVANDGGYKIIVDVGSINSIGEIDAALPVDIEVDGIKLGTEEVKLTISATGTYSRNVYVNDVLVMSKFLGKFVLSDNYLIIGSFNSTTGQNIGNCHIINSLGEVVEKVENVNIIDINSNFVEYEKLLFNDDVFYKNCSEYSVDEMNILAYSGGKIIINENGVEHQKDITSKYVKDVCRNN